jgi:hypothetical protein
MGAENNRCQYGSGWDGWCPAKKPDPLEIPKTQGGQ